MLALLEREAQILKAVTEQYKTQKALERQQQELARRQAETEGLVADADRLARAALAVAENNHGYLTILGYLRRQGREATEGEAARHGRQLTGLCRERGIKPGQLTHPRYGFVNTYPETLLDDYFTAHHSN